MIHLLNTRFIPVAENCSPLQTQQDEKGIFFRKVAEQGHYAGRTVPSATRQGQYTCTADGRLLSSCNVRQAADLLQMLQQALERWEQLGGSSDQESIPTGYAIDPIHPSLYPDGGLVLHVFSRDLPRVTDTRPDDWRLQTFNMDFAWFTREEVRAFVPENAEPGRAYPLPALLVQRIARFHLLDNTRGETPAWRAAEVQQAEMAVTVVRNAADEIELRLEGRARCEAQGSWAVRPFQEQTERERGIAAMLLGRALYRPSRAAFTRFDLVAIANRWGGTEHNCRWDDQEPAPLGIAFTLAGTSARDRVPPHANLWDYFGLPRPVR